MKISKRIAMIILVIVCLGILGNGIYLTQASKTVDCAGAVNFVDIENQTISITDTNNVNYLLKVTFFTALKDIDNAKITIDNLNVGDFITANFHGKWESPDRTLTATYIKVAK